MKKTTLIKALIIAVGTIFCFTAAGCMTPPPGPGRKPAPSRGPQKGPAKKGPAPRRLAENTVQIQDVLFVEA